jgi:hypothetical protein
VYSAKAVWVGNVACVSSELLYFVRHIAHSRVTG